MSRRLVTGRVYLVLLLVAFGLAANFARTGDSRGAEPPAEAPRLVAISGDRQPDDIRFSPGTHDVLAIRGNTSGRAGLSMVVGRGLKRVRYFGRGVTSGSLSPDATRVALYVSGVQGPRIVFESLDGHRVFGRSARLPYQPYADPQIIWSPNAERVVVGEGRRSRVLDARTGRLVGTVPAPVTYLDRQLWDPAGRRLAVPTEHGISLVNPVNHAVRRLGRTGDGEGLGAWSPDGRFILARNKTRIVLLDTKSDSRVVLPISTVGEEVAWSPDGRRIAFFGEPTTVLGRISLRTLEIGRDGTPGGITVSEAASSGSRSGYLLRWSPDGTQLAFYAHQQI